MVHLIPGGFLGNAALAVLVVLSFFLLSRGADRLVEAAVDTARDLRVPQLVIGATIVSLGTTTPEATVSVMAALRGESGLALGNGIGSVIFDQAFILGLSMTLVRLPLRRAILFRQSAIVIVAALCLVIYAYLSPTRTITRTMGFLLVIGLCLYMWISFYWAKHSKGTLPNPDDDPGKSRRPLWKALAALVLGLAMLILGSEILIPSVSVVAFRLGISEAVIAASLVACGTSMPELMTAIASCRKGHTELILGNVLGADGLNILFVIGVSAAAAPLTVEPVFYRIQAPMMMLVLILFQVYLFTTHGHFRRWQGALFLACYLVFLWLQFGGKVAF